MSETLTAPDVESAYAALRDALQGALHGAVAPHLIGIRSGGAWVASRLHRELGLVTPLGLLSSSFHRDDYGQRVGRGLPADMKPSELPLEIDGAHLVLVDDILFTGRTVRAALNELFDYGRPAKVELAVLIDRGGRELPIEARYCGVRAPLAPPRNYVLSQDDADRFSLRIE
ncbi:MAG TPA: bifunctional pyr operon transcriptional regulator/uracil phosphoribosyltransferase PyrR [Burkholderiaceae bacterium]|jgi:pyrimidine operon attenuation protein/uracil phosphoribosyltransferase|nr:bifunctional pyr operon transcriptional regulator/uracil phosphoribosyltransferase PyrR [Burkholderiaceae bacterium]